MTMTSTFVALCVLGAVAGLALLVRLRARVASHNATAQARAAPLAPDEIDAYIREHATALGRETFPDNPEVRWMVHAITRTPQLILAEVEPRPDEVGYARFKFAFVASGATPPRHVATYCLEQGRFHLLCTAPGAPPGLPRRVE
jgi:hypothetical protein